MADHIHHYTIKDVCSGRAYVSTDDYRQACRLFFHIVDAFYDGDDDKSSDLHLVDNYTGKAMSVVL